jgi:SAM-dependent methyltransferase
MQTPAEKRLVHHLAVTLHGLREAGEKRPRILNVGAGRSVSIEDQLLKLGFTFVADRVDVGPCEVHHPAAGEAWRRPIERMEGIEDGLYAAAFANYVLEHVADARGAAREVHRVLRPGGVFVAAVPNPRAPEFLLARATPLAFHRRVRGDEAWPTHYAYRSISGLVSTFENAGFCTVDVAQYSFVEGYLERFRLLRAAGRLYDRLVMAIRLRPCMGNVCVAFGQRPR